MMLPAAMPAGPALAMSAVLIESGLVVLVVTLLGAPAWGAVGGGLIAAGLASFVAQIRQTLKRRLPRPPALPSRDWSTWQTHAALVWLVIATALGMVLSSGVPDANRLTLMWLYGVAGLLGFLAQIVVGMQGRLIPLYAWYRALAARGAPPAYAANALPSARFARPIFIAWSLGVPLLSWGLPTANRPAISAAAAVLFAGLCIGAVYMAHMIRAARS
jgi:hypothetical protein